MVYAVIAKKNEEVFKTCLVPSLQKHNIQCFQILDEEGKRETILQKYNLFFDKIVPDVPFQDSDIIMFVHEDVQLLDENVITKLEYIFNTRPDIGLVGIAGARSFDGKHGWWTNSVNICGHLIQGNDNDYSGQHLVYKDIGFFDDVVAIDGCFMATTAKAIKQGFRFDDVTFTNNDMYDVDLSFQMLEKGFKVAVTDIMIYHKSEGMGAVKETYAGDLEKLKSKWIEKGFEFPVVTKVQPNILSVEV